MSNPSGSMILPEATIRSLAIAGGTLVPKPQQTDIVLDAQIIKLQTLLENLLLTVAHIDINGAHRTAACNLLCTVLDQCSQSPIEPLRALVWEDLTLLRAFEVYLTQHHALNIKPSRQLLITLTSVLAKSKDAARSKFFKDAVLRRLASILCSTSEHVPLRPAMTATAHFLTKKLFSADELYAVAQDTPDLPKQTPVASESTRALLNIVLRWAPYDDYSSSAGALASAILENNHPIKRQVAQSPSAGPAFYAAREVPWASSVLNALAGRPASLDNFRHYVFPELFKHDFSDYIAFLECLDLHRILGAANKYPSDNVISLPQDQLENVLFCALSVGSKLGLVQVAETNNHSGGADNQLFFSGNTLSIPDALLGSLLLQTSATVRIAGLSMLVASNTTTKPLSLGTINALKKGLPHLHADTDAGFRSEMFSLIRNLTDRLRAATCALSKLAARDDAIGKQPDTMRVSVVGHHSLLKSHKSFLQWYLSFLKMDLRPSASYQRHISALKSISLICRSGVDPRVPLLYRAKTAGPKVSWPFELDVVDEAMTQLLLDLLLDPFDDVRQASAEILSIVKPRESSDDRAMTFDSTTRLISVLRKAEHSMMLTGRADQADGVAHIYSAIFARCEDVHTNGPHWWKSKYGVLDHLLDTLEETLHIAANDMSRAVSKHPLHGLFISLRYILETPGFYRFMAAEEKSASALRVVHHRLQECFHSVWSCVKDTLCNDAPEGYMPDELDEEDSVGTKDILSYSWRALKESSLLMRSIVKSCPTNHDTSPLINEQLREMGDLSFAQLAELRHRGAFSTVAQTFTTCCVRCNGVSDTSLHDWYQQAILCIQNQTTINTRRSAGLPSLMVGIVIADESSGRLFQQAMQDLAHEATKPVDSSVEQAGGLSQVHALNCLKDIFKNSKLGDRSEAHVPEALGLAADCLSSETWAIRNSGLMLFRALLDRLLGTNDSYVNVDAAPQSRLSFAAVPNLIGVVLRLLSPPVDSMQDLQTEGVFPALQLLQRTPPPQDMLDEVRQAVLNLTTSPQWHIRDKAAATYALLVSPSARLETTTQLICGAQNNLNGTHGALVCARYIMGRCGTSLPPIDIETFLASLRETAELIYHSSDCPFTRAAFVDLYNDWCAVARVSKYNVADLGKPLCAVAELESLSHLGRDSLAVCSALTQSLAHAALQEVALSNQHSPASTDTLSTLIKLAQFDMDACASMLERAALLCSTDESFRSGAGDILTLLAARLLFNRDMEIDIEVQAEAQNVLIALLDSERVQSTQDTLCKEAEVLYLSENSATPLFQDKRLLLQGALLELRFRGAQVPGHSLPDDFYAWATSIKPATLEDNPFDTRIAAAQACARISHGLKTLATESEYSEAFLTYCLSVYDLTNDDDDDVRNIAAAAACNILHSANPANHTHDLIPLPAGSRLAEFLCRRFKANSRLAEEAISRLTGSVVGKSENWKSVNDVLSQCSKQDTALFVQEKQNLFIDEAREARLWSQVLMQMSEKAVSPEVVNTLATWVADGLDTLTSALEPEADGPLGWKRRPEVFVLGLRVVLSTDVLLDLCRKSSKKMPVAPMEIRAKLARLLVEGKEKLMHPLLVEEVQRLLEKSIAAGFGKLDKVVTAVAERVGA